jgi:hypothetical protein
LKSVPHAGTHAHLSNGPGRQVHWGQWISGDWEIAINAIR